ncbi:methyltransferase domain-containing protein [Patescibacteria group bacterium]
MKLKRLLTFLKCPYCELAELRLESKTRLICGKCSKLFSIIDGIPVLMRKASLGRQEKCQLNWFENHYSQFSKEDYRLENWRLSMLKRIFDNRPKKINTYLDLGCGATGYTVIEGARRNKWLSFGADISFEAMLRAKALAGKQGVAERTGFVVCSAERLPFKDNLFDYVSAISLLEHLENDLQVIKGVSRIVKEKGAVYVCVPNTYKRMWPFLWPVYFWIDKNIGHKRHYSIENLSLKMAKEGFRLDRVFYNGHLIKLLQLTLEKLRLINEENWWQLEKKDLNRNPMGIQLNAVYTKI